MIKKGRFIVTRCPNRNSNNFIDYISWDVSFETKEGFEHIAEFVFRSDAIKFKKLKNNEFLVKGLYDWGLK